MDKYLNLHVKLNDAASAGLKKLSGLITGAVVLGIGKKAVQATVQWEKALGNVETLLGKGSTQIKEFDVRMTEMLKTVPLTPEELGASAYQIVSAGISDTASAMKVLEASSKLAVAGLGTSEQATDLLTSALNAFQLSGEDAAETANILFKTVKGGKTTVAELADQFGAVAPIAVAAGVSLAELQATTAALTTSGVQTAAAQVQVKAALTNLIKPGKELSGVLGQMGIENVKLEIQNRGLVPLLRDLKSAVGDDEIAFAKLFPNVRATSAALALTGAAGDKVDQIYADLTNGVDQLTSSFESQTEKTHAQFQILQNELFVALKEFGVVIIPPLLVALDALVFSVEMIGVTVTTLKGVWDDAWPDIRDTALGVINVLDPKIRSLTDLVEGLILAFQKLTRGRQAVENDIYSARQASVMSSEQLSAAREFESTPGLPPIQTRTSQPPSRFATGGLVGDTIPAMLSPGEVVLNAAQQKNVASGLSGAQITITGNTFLDENSAEKVADLFTKKLALHMAI